MTERDLQQKYIDRLNEKTLPGIDFGRLDRSCNSADTGYAEEVLGNMHRAFAEVYGTGTLECDGEHEFVTIPAVIQARNTGRLTLALLDLDLESSGEHWGTTFFSPAGILQQGSENNSETVMNYIREKYIPYDYWYTPNIHGDIHVDSASAPEAVANLLNSAINQQAPNQSGMEMTQS